MNLVIDAGWVTGMLLATVRTGSFIVASPIFGKAIPAIGRVGLALALGFVFATPTEPGTLLDLLGWAFTNGAIGLFLGFVTGILFWLFSVAGGLIDFSSALSSASIFDPVTQTQNPVFGRFFNLMAVALFLVIGGDRLLVSGLGISFEAIGITGGIELGGGIADVSVTLLSRMLIAAIELAMPALAALFITEVVLGLASRFAPQANVFLVGLPAKIVAAFASLGAVLLLVPETMDGLLAITRDSIRDVINSLAG